MCVFFKGSSMHVCIDFQEVQAQIIYTFTCIYSCMKFVLNGPNSKFLNYYVLIKLTHYETK